VGCSKRRKFFCTGIFHLYNYVRTSVRVHGLWNVQEYSGSNPVWAGDGRFCADSQPICGVRHGIKLAIFCIAQLNCIFQRASFGLIKSLATLIPKKLQGFYGTVLYHCYTLTYAYLALLIGSWNLQENWLYELFWAGGNSSDAKHSVYYCFWPPPFKLATFLIAQKECIFKGTSFALKKHRG